MSRFFPRLAGVLLLLGTIAPARAAVVYVGAGCDFTDLQQAIDAAPASGNEIRLAKSLTNQHVNIDGKSLSVIGGFESCSAQMPNPALLHTISAGSHTDDSVITIRGAVEVVLQNLVISDGKESSGGYGGGIDFIGRGSLVLSHVGVQNNRAGHGAGINVDPDGITSLTLKEGSYVYNNTATYSGAGIRLEGQSRLYMIDGTSSINGNSTTGTSDGHGGGLQIVGPARADIGSGVISGNSSMYGGGIAVESKGVVRLFSTVSGKAANVTYNTASKTGGGIYLDGTGSPPPNSAVCGFGYDISRNAAQEGAAIYADSGGGYGAYVLLTQADTNSSSYCGPEPATLLGAVDCALDQPCNRMDANVTRTAGGEHTDGAVVLVQSDRIVQMERVRISGSNAGYAVRTFSNSGNFAAHEARDCLFEGNTLDHELIHGQDNGAWRMRRCTIAGNTLGGGSVISVDGPLALVESLNFQPGKTLLDNRVGSLLVRNVMSNEIGSIGGARADIVAVTDPRFKNPAAHNYRLAPDSPAVDFAAVPTSESLPNVDMDGRPRKVDLPVTNLGGPLDLGPYELQSLATFPPDESFDTVIPPALPDGWEVWSTGIGASTFRTVPADGANLMSNAIYTEDSPILNEKLLYSPWFNVISKGRLSFRQRVDMEPRDGVALDIVIGAGQTAGQDIITAGGHFVSEPYNGGMAAPNPLGDRLAWTGTTPDFRQVIVDLPPSADGQSVRLRWHMGTNSGVGGGGYWLDDVHVDLDTRVTDRLFCDAFDGIACDP